MAFEVEHALVYKLRNTAAVSALVGNRIYALHLPELAVLPALVYAEISLTDHPTHDETPAGALVSARFQIDAWAGSNEEGIILAKAVFIALHGFSGIITSGANSLHIQSSLRVARRKNFDQETRVYWVSQDFMLWFVE